MANKRMFSLDIVDSDAFVGMPLSTQALYFHLSMRADDDGFVKNPKRIQRDIGSNEDDMKVLIAKRFILPFDSGIVVIKHWKINNNIRSDRYKPTTYIEERSMLVLKENGAYTEAENLGIPNDNQVGDTRYAQYSIGKDSIDKVSLGERGNVREDSAIYGEFKNVVLAPSDHERLVSMFGEKVAGELIDNLSRKLKSKGYKYEDHYATILIWAQKDGVKPESAASSMGSSFDTDEFFKAALARSYKK